jgi:UbiD family decarboxylase
VDIFNTHDVLWAMTTRYQGDVSTVFIPGVRCHPLDPTQTRAFNPLLLADGTSCKTVFDCTVPVRLRDRFRRAEFLEVELPAELRG